MLERRKPKFAVVFLKLVVFQFLCPIVYGVMVWNQTNVSHEQIFGTLSITTDPILLSFQVLATGWFLSVLSLLPSQLRMFYRDRILLRGNVPVEMEGAEELLQDVCKDLNIRRRIRLYANDSFYSPVRIGLIRPMILLPFGMECSELELRMIYIHELTHYLHHDLGYKIACFFIQLIHWFNPFVGNLVELYEEWAETACDIRTCEKGQAYFSPREYALMLIHHARTETERGPQGHLFSLCTGNELEKRIRRLMTIKTEEKSRPKFIVIVFMIALFMGNTAPAFAASHLLEKGYEAFYIYTADLSLEKPSSSIWGGRQGYRKNQTYKVYDWNIPANTFSHSFAFSCSSGEKINMQITCDHFIQAGIIEPNGDMRCRVGSGPISQTFSLDQTGTYHFYVKNTNDFEIHLEAIVIY
ncbi:M56 family metallopeptidase [Hominifimenecus sp. rT4P-3]|uniref:M56 family metallopeptidase n=1 Tax=Hominifimenecus sp. rT4P-3 TaxID=3242979 RepID=UPI003DA486C9